MPDVPSAYTKVLNKHRKRVVRLAERQGVQQLRRTYETAIHQLERKLVKVTGRKRDTFTAHQYRVYLGQLRQGVAVLNQRMVDGISDISRKVQVEAVRDLIDDIAKLEKTFAGTDIVLPIEDAARFQGVVNGVRESMLRTHKVSVAKYGAGLIQGIESELTSSLLTAEDLGTTIDRVMKTADTQWWQAERVARTELMWAYNATQRQGIQETAGEVPDMMMRWSEHISDSSGTAMDNRVDGGRIEDSHAMHGQVAPAGGLFHFPTTMADGSPVSPALARFSGKSWSNPPNRPNDRATLAPWRPHWGIPAWRWVGGARVQM